MSTSGPGEELCGAGVGCEECGVWVVSTPGPGEEVLKSVEQGW